MIVAAACAHAVRARDAANRSARASSMARAYKAAECGDMRMLVASSGGILQLIDRVRAVELVEVRRRRGLRGAEQRERVHGERADCAIVWRRWSGRHATEAQIGSPPALLPRVGDVSRSPPQDRALLARGAPRGGAPRAPRLPRHRERHGYRRRRHARARRRARVRAPPRRGGVRRGARRARGDGGARGAALLAARRRRRRRRARARRRRGARVGVPAVGQRCSRPTRRRRCAT